MLRVESVRESFRSTSSRVGAVGRRGELDSQPDGLVHGRNPINSSNSLVLSKPEGGGDGAGNTEGNIDVDVNKEGGMCA